MMNIWENILYDKKMSYNLVFKYYFNEKSITFFLCRKKEFKLLEKY